MEIQEERVSKVDRVEEYLPAAKNRQGQNYQPNKIVIKRKAWECGSQVDKAKIITPQKSITGSSKL